MDPKFWVAWRVANRKPHVRLFHERKNAVEFWNELAVLRGSTQLMRGNLLPANLQWPGELT